MQPVTSSCEELNLSATDARFLMQDAGEGFGSASGSVMLSAEDILRSDYLDIQDKSAARFLSLSLSLLRYWCACRIVASLACRHGKWLEARVVRHNREHIEVHFVGW